MSTQQPGTGPVPESSGADPAEDDTQRLDLPADGARDGGTRVLPGSDEPAGVDALWSLDRPDDAPTAAAAPAASGAPEPSPAWQTAATPETAEASESAAAPVARERTGRRAVRVGTVVWGLVVVACGVLALAVAGGATVDGGTVAIAILGGAGVALVLGSIVTGVRRRDQG